MAPVMSRLMFPAVIGLSAVTAEHFEVHDPVRALARYKQERTDKLIAKAVECNDEGSNQGKCPEGFSCKDVHVKLSHSEAPVQMGRCLPPDLGSRRLCVDTDAYGDSPVDTDADGPVGVCQKGDECIVGDLEMDGWNGYYYECKRVEGEVSGITGEGEVSGISILQEKAGALAKDLEKQASSLMDELEKRVGGFESIAQKTAELEAEQKVFREELDGLTRAKLD